MTATATLSATEEALPTFLFEGRSAGAFDAVLVRQVGPTSSGISPGATGADNVLASFSVVANTLNRAPQGNAGPNAVGTQTSGLRIRAGGHFASSASNNKTVKLIVNPASATVGSTVGSGGTTLITSGTLTSTASANGWVMEAYLYAYGVAVPSNLEGTAYSPNVQVAGQIQAQFGSSVITPVTPSYLTIDQSQAFFIAVTGNAGTSATDIVLDWFEILGTN